MNRSLVILASCLALFPTLAINTTYLIAAGEGFVPWCFPYLDSCTSISATGRHGTAFYVFKITMIPMAVLYWLYWRAVNLRLAQWGYRGRTILRLGTIASLALVCYTLALGAVGDNFQLTRRIGVIFYFTFTYLCQLLVVYRLERHKVPDPSLPWQRSLLLLILASGVLTLILDVRLDNYEDYENAFEWIIALLVHLNFLCAAIGWRFSGRPGSARDP